MEQSKQDGKLGRFLSLVLRHDPSAAGINLDQNGWADVEELLEGVRRTGRNMDREALERIVRENNKQRYSLNGDRSKIRANQGHSVVVDVELERKSPPEHLYHGTASRFLAGILREGLTCQNRRHVHLSADLQTAVSVGRRHGRPVVLLVEAAAMERDGHAFWLSKNGVWLCEAAPARYLSQLDQTLCPISGETR